MSETKGKLIVISAPGGTGKGTIIKKYLETYSSDTVLSVSCTSRAPRPADATSAYQYVTREEFEELMSKEKLLEYVEFCDNYYGTPKDFVLEKIEQNKNVFLEIDTVGALNVRKNFPDAVLIFVLTPTVEELRRRLETRGTDAEERIQQRITKAKNEEVPTAKEFKYLVINDKLEDSVEALRLIIEAEQSNSKDAIDKLEKYYIKNDENMTFIENFEKQL